MANRNLLAGASALLLFASAGQALSQDATEPPQDEERHLSILIQEELYILELGIGVYIDVRCFGPSRPTGDPAGVEGPRQPDEDARDSQPPDGVSLGPCGISDGQSRVHRLLDRLDVTRDMAAELKVLLERELRERIEDKIKSAIDDRIRSNRENAESGGNR